MYCKSNYLITGFQQARGSAVPPSVPPPPTLPPPPDPDYEVIEFTTQQAYSNAPPPRPAPPGIS